MPSIQSTLKWLLVAAPALVAAAPAGVYQRQESSSSAAAPSATSAAAPGATQAAAPGGGLTDVDILQLYVQTVLRRQRFTD